jgi:hypothetical protein
VPRLVFRLASCADKARRRSRHASADTPARITTVGVVTADRPARLCRALDSLVGQASRYGRHPRLLVIDGSRHSVNRRATRAVVHAAGTASGQPVQYVGRAEAARLRRALGSDGDIAAPVAGPGVIGASRNLFLLLTAGERVLAVDDDIVCDPWGLPGPTASLAVTGHGFQFLEGAFFPTRRAARAATTRMAVDVFAAHEALLGRTLSSLLDHDPAADLTEACRFVRSSIAAGRRLTVRATYAGVSGDAATHCPYRLLFSDGALRSQLWSSPAIFRRAIGSRETLRIASRALVTHNAGCMAGCMGLVNQGTLPPFMTVGRNEDGVFGTMLAACDPWAVFGHAPVGVRHDSHRPARRVRRRILSATENRVSDLVIALVPELLPPTGSRSPRLRLRRFGRAIAEIGRLPPRALADLVGEQTLKVRARDWRHADETLADPACPRHWRGALDRYRRAYDTSVRRPAFFLPIEFHGQGSVETGFRELGRYLRTFGALVSEWPGIWDRARRLNPRV